MWKTTEIVSNMQTCISSRGPTQDRKQMEMRSAAQTQTAFQNLQTKTQGQWLKQKQINQ